MPVRRPKDLTQALKQGTIERIYFLFGPETYLRDQAARAIADEAMRDTLLREFNDISISLADGNAHAAVAEAEQLPMMSSRRVIRVTDFTKLDEDNEAILLEYLERPVETSVVVFVANDIDKRKKFAKTLMQGAAFEFAPLNDGELTAWARAHLKELKTEVEADVLRRIVELVGSDVRTLSNELNKLSAAALPSGKITMALVEALVGRSRELMNWDLTDQMLARNRPRALQVLEHLLDDGAPPVMLIGLIGSTYRRLALARALLSQGVSSRDIFRQVPMPPFRQQSYLYMVIGVVGTTIAPWMQFYLQSSIVEKGVTRRQYKASQIDVIAGCIFTDIVAWFIIVACAATLYVHGYHNISDAKDAAQALRPLAGDYAYILFAVGLFNASLFAASILPLSTAYTVCEGLGFESGVGKRFSEAPVFYWLYTILIVAGAGVILIPNLPLVKISILSQVVNGIAVTPVLIFMLLLVNKKELMGEYVNSRLYNVVAWITTVVMTALSIAWFWTLRAG